MDFDCHKVCTAIVQNILAIWKRRWQHDHKIAHSLAGTRDHSPTYLFLWGAYDPTKLPTSTCTLPEFMKYR
eukprot:5528784-Amphidinium_carterae.1